MRLTLILFFVILILTMCPSYLLVITVQQIQLGIDAFSTDGTELGVFFCNTNFDMYNVNGNLYTWSGSMYNTRYTKLCAGMPTVDITYNGKNVLY